MFLHLNVNETDNKLKGFCKNFYRTLQNVIGFSFYSAHQF